MQFAAGVRCGVPHCSPAGIAGFPAVAGMRGRRGSELFWAADSAASPVNVSGILLAVDLAPMSKCFQKHVRGLPYT